MNGHIEYINGFPVWVDGETNWKTSFTSTSTGIAEDLPYYPSTTTTPIEKIGSDCNLKMSELSAMTTVNLLISDCNPKYIDLGRARKALAMARTSLCKDIPSRPVVLKTCFGLRTKYFCPKCGSSIIVGEDVNYCRVCGKRLDWGMSL